MKRHPEGRKAHAHALRNAGMSYSVISEKLEVPVSTLGYWLQGKGEAAMVKECWCGERFIARRRDQFACSPAHMDKHWRIFGAVPKDVRGAVA